MHYYAICKDSENVGKIKSFNDSFVSYENEFRATNIKILCYKGVTSEKIIDFDLKLAFNKSSNPMNNANGLKKFFFNFNFQIKKLKISIKIKMRLMQTQIKTWKPMNKSKILLSSTI